MNQPALLKLAWLLLLACSTDAKMNIIAPKLDVAVGEELFLLCKAGEEGDITWQKDGESIDDDEIVSMVDETSSKLLIKEAKLEDSGKYTCLCVYDSGHQDDVKTTIYVYEGPSFGSTKTYHEFLEGSSEVVPCLVTGQPAVVVHWRRDKQEISTDVGARVRQLSNNALRIESVRRDDAGTYVCRAQIKGRSISQQLAISVVVNAPPKVRLREEVKKVMAGSQTNATFVCLVDGLPKPNITWTMPVTFDPSRHHVNSDRSQLTVQSVTRADFGEYICTATNKIAEDSATIMLHVFEAPEVFLSVEQQSVSVGKSVSVSCNVSGHPQPELHWLNKHNGRKLVQASSGRVRVVDGVLMIEDVVPSDGGLYSCMAVSASGNASRDVEIHTQPGLPHHLSASPGSTSVLFYLKVPPVSGGTPITHYVLQWKQSAAKQWNEIKVPASGPLAIASLKPYTSYMVRLAALNAVGLGQFSDTHSVYTQGIREPDRPLVLSDEMKVEGNSFSVPIKQIDDGGTPLLHFNMRYKQDKDGSDWTKKQLPSKTESVILRDLAFSSDYQLEITAVNTNGSSMPATFNFTTAEQPVKTSSMTKGSVVGIVMVIFLVAFLAVDATCCYRNRCGLLMSIAVKLFGQKVPGLKMLEEGDRNTNGEVTLNSISTLRGSLQHTGVQTLSSEGGQLRGVTCDKAPLTKHEKTLNIA